MRNAAQTLNFVDSEDKRLAWASETIIRQVDHMTRLVDDLLDIVRLKRDTLSLRKETVDMAVIVHHALESTKALFDARKHHLTVAILGEPLLIDGDSVRLTQIMENLLSNAARFAENSGKIKLDVHGEGHELVISVETMVLASLNACFHRFSSSSCRKSVPSGSPAAASALGFRLYPSLFPCMTLPSQHQAKAQARAANSSWTPAGRYCSGCSTRRESGARDCYGTYYHRG